MTYCTTNVWHCNIVPIDSFSITNIWQGATDLKSLIFHQYFTWNLQSRCHISLDLCCGALTFFSTLSYPWRGDWKDTLTWRKAFFLPNTDQMNQLSDSFHSKEIWWRTRFFRVLSSVSYWELICKVLLYNTRLKLWQVLFITQGRIVSFWGCVHEKKRQSDEGVPNWFHASPPSWISKEHFQ